METEEEAFSRECSIWFVEKDERGRLWEGLKKESAAARESANVLYPSSSSTLPSALTTTTAPPAGTFHDLSSFVTYNSALRHCLAIELGDWFVYNKRPTVTTDTCLDDYLGPPGKFVNWQGQVTLNEAFESLPPSVSLDPTTRFKRVSTTLPLAASKWITDSSGGLALEVQVAYECGKRGVPCLHCKKVGVLAWGGGADGAWKDVVCGGCGACYEIKAKNRRPFARIEKYRTFDNGGSLFSFRGLLDPRVPKFLVIVRRAESGESSHSVHISKIKAVRPKLSHKMFMQDSGRRRPLQEGSFKSKSSMHLEAVDGGDCDASCFNFWFEMDARFDEDMGEDEDLAEWQERVCRDVFREVVTEFDLDGGGDDVDRVAEELSSVKLE